MSPAEPSHPEGRVATADVTLIRGYARNPRRQLNPEYDRIKASIRAEGLDQPLVLSQVPGTDGYVLHSGGNTRLRILQELLVETGDDRFRWVHGVVVPWTQESTALFAHLRENDLRGGLPFIDKALAVFEAKALLEQELSVECLSQRQLEDAFRERGFSLSHSMISKMAYAVETLWPVMPKALSAGLGRPQVEKLRTLERAVKDVWSRHGLGDGSECDPIFAELCRRYDAEEWDIQPLRDALEHELAQETDIDRHVIRLEVEAALAGRPFEPAVSVASDRADLAATQAKQTVTSTVLKANPKPQTGTRSREDQASTANAAPAPSAPAATPELDSLRTQLFQDALALATHHGLAGCVQPLPNQGLGFVVMDVPPPELTDTLDAEALGLVSAVWWQLAACSDLTTAPLEGVLPHMRESSVLHEALATHNSNLLFNGVWTPDPAYLNGQLWQQLTPEDWQLWLRMTAAYRTLTGWSCNRGITLWVIDEDHRHVIQ